MFEPSYTRRAAFSAMAIATFGLIAATPASAQPYPNKPIKIIAPVQPGGCVDLVARTIADRLGRALGVSNLSRRESGTSCIRFRRISVSGPDVAKEQDLRYERVARRWGMLA